MPGKKRICLVIQSLQAGGMERVMSELVWHFASKNDSEIHLILYGITREIFYKVPDNITIHKPSFEFNNSRRFLSTVKTLSFLRKKIKSINPDTILNFGEYWNSFFLISTIGLKYPKYISDRNQPGKSLGKFHDMLRYLLYPKATGIIVQTAKAKEIYKKKYRHKNIAVIANPVREINCPGNEKKENYVLMVGRFIRSKHQDMLIKIFSRIELKGWKLVLVGYDHLKQKNKDKLKKIAKSIGIYHRVIFTGKLGNPDELYCKSSVFAFTSSSEGFPNVIGEAMSAGLPVVAFDCVAGPSEMIKDGENGFLVPLFDSDTFVSRLKLLMEDEELRVKFGNNARQSIKRFARDKICEEYYEFITG